MPPNRPVPSRLARTIVRWRFRLFLIAVAVVAAAYPTSTAVRTERTVDAMLSPQHPAAVAVRRVRSSLGDAPIVMLVYDDAELASIDGIARNQTLTKAVAATSGVRGVLSPSVLESIVARMRPLGRRPALFQPRDKVAVGFNRMFASYTHAADHRHAAVVAIVESASIDRTLGQMRSQLDRWSTEIGRPIRLIGEPVLIDDAFELIHRDGRRMAAFILIALTAVIFVTTRDWRPAAAAAGTISGAFILTRALLVWLDIPSSLVSSVLAAIVAVISVTSCLHLSLAAGEVHIDTDDRRYRIAVALDRVGMSIVWTCATTAAGFAALAASEILPIEQFGAMVAIAACLVPVMGGMITPAVLSIGPLTPRRHGATVPDVAALEPTTTPVPSAADDVPNRSAVQVPSRLSGLTVALTDASIRRRTPLMLCTVAATVVAMIGLGRSTVESNFLANFRADSEIVRDYGRFEKNFGGAGIWDVVVPVPPRLDRDTMNELRDLQTRLGSIRVDPFGNRIGTRVDVPRFHSITKVLSLADADLVAKDAPLMRFVAPETRLGVMESAIPEFYRTLITPGAERDRSSRRWFRIMLRSSEDISTDARTGLIREVRRELRKSPFRDGYVAGYYVVLTNLVASLLGDQWRCMWVALVGIAALLACALRRGSRVVLALAVNVFPTLWVLGAAGLFTGRINMGAAMIAAVSVGLSIDGSIHYLRNLAPSDGDPEWLRAAATKTGPPLLIATAALFIGFWMLRFSDFVPTATFGALLSWTVLISTVANLTLLPAALAATATTRSR